MNPNPDGDPNLNGHGDPNGDGSGGGGDSNLNGDGGRKRDPEPRLRRIPLPPIPPEQACHNLAWRTPLLHQDGIATYLYPHTNSVLVTRKGGRSILMTPGPHEWISSPFYAELTLPLDSYHRLAHRLHHLLTQ